MTVNISLAEKRGIGTAFHSIAIVSTTFRLYYRRKRDRLWWDDFWAFVAVIFDIIKFVTLWLKGDGTDGGSPSIRQLRIVVFWLRAITFPVVVWSSRISIAMSISRLVLPKTRVRRSLFLMSCCFALLCCAQLIQKVWVCCRDTSWHNRVYIQCYLGKNVGIISLCTDVIADTYLIVVPLHLLWKVGLPRSQRRLILAIFAASALSTSAGIVYAVLVLGGRLLGASNGFLIGLATDIMAGVTLSVCNLLVVVMYIYCLFWKVEDGETSESTATPRPTGTAISLTDVSDMGISEGDTRFRTSKYASSLRSSLGEHSGSPRQANN